MEPDTIDRIGRFRILERLGSGGSRDVFLAEDETGTRVVLKVLAAPHRNQGLLDPRLADEASTYARLVHPNLVRVVDLFSAGGHFVIALESLDAASLNVVRAVLKRSGGALDDPASLYVGACLFAGIAAAHEARDAGGRPSPVLHRNVNPSNVLVSWDGGIKLGNFNVANIASVLRDSNPGFTWGSYGYFAPEHVLKRDVGPPADVYSASLVLWELLAGRKAIERGALTEDEVLSAMATPRITSLDIVRADLDKHLRDMVHAGLETDSAKRLITASEIHATLAALVDTPKERARMATTLERVRPDAARPRVASRSYMRAAAALPGLSPAAAGGRGKTIESIASSVPTGQGRGGGPSQPERPGAYHWVEPPDPDPVQGPAIPVARRPVTLTLGAQAAPVPAPASEPAPVPAPASQAGFAPVPAPAPRVWPWIVGSCGVLLLAIVALGFVLSRPGPRSTPEASATASSSMARLVPALPTTVPSVAPSADPATAETQGPAIASDQGELRFPPFAAGHRIIVDGQVVGDGAQPAVVRCGVHELRIGSSGTLQHVDVPCGGALDVSPR